MASRTRLSLRLVPLPGRCPHSGRPVAFLPIPIQRRALPNRYIRTFTFSSKHRQQPSPYNNVPPPPPPDSPPPVYFPQESPPTTILVNPTPQPRRPPPGPSKARILFRRTLMLTLYATVFSSTYLIGLSCSSYFFPFDPVEPDSEEDIDFTTHISKWLASVPWLAHSIEEIKHQGGPLVEDSNHLTNASKINALDANPYHFLEGQPLLSRVLIGSRALPASRAVQYLQFPNMIPPDANEGLYPSGRLETFWLGPGITGWPGTIHGGATATVLQHSMREMVMWVCNAPYLPITRLWGGAAAFRYDVSYPVSFTVNYMKPIRAGDLYCVQSLVTHVAPSGDVTQTTTTTPVDASSNVTPPPSKSENFSLPFDIFVTAALQAASAKEDKPLSTWAPETPHRGPKQHITLMIPTLASSVHNPRSENGASEWDQADDEVLGLLAKGITPDLRGRYYVIATLTSNDLPSEATVFAEAQAVFDVTDVDKSKWGVQGTQEVFEEARRREKEEKRRKGLDVWTDRGSNGSGKDGKKGTGWRWW